LSIEQTQVGGRTIAVDADIVAFDIQDSEYFLAHNVVLHFERVSVLGHDVAVLLQSEFELVALLLGVGAVVLLLAGVVEEVRLEGHEVSLAAVGPVRVQEVHEGVCNEVVVVVVVAEGDLQFDWAVEVGAVQLLGVLLEGHGQLVSLVVADVHLERLLVVGAEPEGVAIYHDHELVPVQVLA